MQNRKQTEGKTLLTAINDRNDCAGIQTCVSSPERAGLPWKVRKEAGPGNWQLGHKKRKRSGKYGYDQNNPIFNLFA